MILSTMPAACWALPAGMRPIVMSGNASGGDDEQGVLGTELSRSLMYQNSDAESSWPFDVPIGPEMRWTGTHETAGLLVSPRSSSLPSPNSTAKRLSQLAKA